MKVIIKTTKSIAYSENLQMKLFDLCGLDEPPEEEENDNDEGQVGNSESEESEAVEKKRLARELEIITTIGEGNVIRC